MIKVFLFITIARAYRFYCSIFYSRYYFILDEVSIHRLKWQSIWPTPLTGDGSKVCAIAWRADEKVIAIAYDSGLIKLVIVETKEELFQLSVRENDIASLSWTQNTEKTEVDFSDDFEVDVPPLPPNTKFSKADYFAEFHSKNVLNFLVIGTKSGQVQLSVFGVLMCAAFYVQDLFPDHIKFTSLLDARLSANFEKLIVFVNTEDGLHTATFNSPLLDASAGPLLTLAKRHSQIFSATVYIDEVLQNIREAWEPALMEMDIRLAQFAKTVSPGVVSADFIELLVFGKASPELELFLRRDITEKGLKKLGNCIEMSYSTIQKLVVHSLQTGILRLFHHLNQVRALSRNDLDYFYLVDDGVEAALQTTGSMLIKAYELQQVIDQSMRDYKIFFRWLYVVIMELMEESAPEDMAQMSQQDINYLADFLSSLDDDEDNADTDFSSDAASKRTFEKTFNLERVGQYLQAAPLKVVVADENTAWQNMLLKNQCIRDSNSVYEHKPDQSLQQLFVKLHDATDASFHYTSNQISENFELTLTVDCGPNPNPDDTRMRGLCTAPRNVYYENYALALISEKCFIFADYSESAHFLKVELHPKPSLFQDGDFQFLDIQFYNNDTLSMLIKVDKAEGSPVYFMQFPMCKLTEKYESVEPDYSRPPFTDSRNVVNFFRLMDVDEMVLVDGLDWRWIAVSGNRKVCSVINGAGNRIRIYETEAEDDSDDDDEMDNLSTNLDTSK